MPDSFFKKYFFAIKWFGIAVSIKLLLFILFAANFIQNWPANWIVNHIFIVSGDTSGYYAPVESFVNGGGYSSYCRMPGLLPIYGPFYFLFGANWGKTCVIILQFLTSAFSVYVLSKAASLLFKNKRIFYITFFLYVFSSFVSIWDHYGYSDSFSTSFLIFSFFLFVRYLENGKNNFIVFSGIFLTWSLFFRPINGLIFACFVFILFVTFFRDFKHFAKATTLFVLPCIIAITTWSAYTFNTHKKFIFLQGSFSDCYAALPVEHLAIRDLIITWGGDFQEWSIGTEAEWFFSKKIDYKTKNFFSESTFTSQYNLDSLLNLKIEYDSLRGKTPLPQSVKLDIQNKIVASAERYRAAYIAERPGSFYFFNRLKFLQKFMFPLHLDNLPFPKVSEMKLYQKVVKGGYLLLLNLVSIMGLIGILISFSSKNLYGIIPLITIFAIACILGFVEQRYLVPEYPFLVVYAAFLANVLNNFRLKKKLRKSL